MLSGQQTFELLKTAYLRESELHRRFPDLRIPVSGHWDFENLWSEMRDRHPDLTMDDLTGETPDPELLADWESTVKRHSYRTVEGTVSFTPWDPTGAYDGQRVVPTVLTVTMDERNRRADFDAIDLIPRDGQSDH
ncbi:hypothetical protein [Bifidobacterium aerophilum]|uniref:Uncharacterized protein n=1 Tax=Bifidobacterium aerophilum TaxID=1798155 RepID=A0A6N9Z935_9BIFI|nr:hypothetical protein [Bifidobacterium aerophilum]NEG90603.1 hypothetical protein [Bifidobacterium aerophilum]